MSTRFLAISALHQRPLLVPLPLLRQDPIVEQSPWRKFDLFLCKGLPDAGSAEPSRLRLPAHLELRWVLQRPHQLVVLALLYLALSLLVLPLPPRLSSMVQCPVLLIHTLHWRCPLLRVLPFWLFKRHVSKFDKLFQVRGMIFYTRYYSW